MVTVPGPPLTGRTPASVNTFDVQSCHDKSFLGAANGGGPLGAGFVVAAPCGRAPALVAKRGPAPRPGTQPVSSTVRATRVVADLMCRLMPTTVAIRSRFAGLKRFEPARSA